MKNQNKVQLLQKDQTNNFTKQKQITKQNNFMQNQSLPKQISITQMDQIKQPRRQGYKYHQLMSKLQEEPFYDDSLFFNKKNIFNIANPQTKKIKTIYHKIILSNKSDPLHPSSYRKYQSSHHAKSQKKVLNSPAGKPFDIHLKINAGSVNCARPQLLDALQNKFNDKQQFHGSKDRKHFFKNLLKKFTQNVDFDNSIQYKQKVHLFKKIFDHYKIKPQQKEHFEQILRKITDKDAQSLYMSSKISTKMNLEERRNNYSVSERRTDSPDHPKLKMKQKNAKTSQYRRTLKQNNLSQILSIESKGQQDQFLSINNTSQLRHEQIEIKQLQKQLSARKADFKTIQDQSQRMSYLTHSQHRNRVLDKKINMNLNQVMKQQTPIDIKLQKFREFLFAINFSNHIFVPLQVDKYQNNFKIYVGKGNNSNLIKSIFKKRFWFQVTKNINQAHLVWTQLKEQSVFCKQKKKIYILEQKIKQIHAEDESNTNIQANQSENLKTQTIQQNPQQEKQFQINKQASNPNQKNIQTLNNKSNVIQQNNVIDFRSLKLKQRPNISKFISVQSQRIYRTKNKADKIQKQSSLHQNSIKLKKYPQLLILKNSTILAKDPLQKLLSSSQMKDFNQLYAKYLKNPLKLPGTKTPTFQERKKDILLSVNGQFLKEQQKQEISIHNHLPFNGILGNKKAMFYILKEYCDITGTDLYNTIPLTYHIKHGLKDDQYKLFIQQFQLRKKNNKINYWVMKPGQFSNRGNGIQCTNKIEQIRKRIQKCVNKIDPKRPKAPLSSKSIILQSYITDLLLYNGRKFDIRTYMMVTIVNGKIKAYWYEQGYIRTSSHLWNLADIQDRQIHLTNDAVQKYSQTYGKYEAGNKLSYRDIQRYLQTYEKASKHVMYQKILPQMKQIATLSLKASYQFLDPSKLQNNFQIFGFDFMLDTKLKPWLIQINTNPCLELGCPILQRIIPNMLQNAFRIAIDPLFPPPSSFSSNYKYNIAENAVNYNKFDLIFDEDRDGPQIKKLYENISLEEILTKIEDIQQDKETFEQEGQQIDLTGQI